MVRMCDTFELVTRKPGKRLGTTQWRTSTDPGMPVHTHIPSPTHPYTSHTHTHRYVFVPAAPSVQCKLFRANHASHQPTHQLTQVRAGPCVLIPLRPLDPRGEITFNYFGMGCVGNDDGSQSTDRSEMDYSLSLSASSESGIALTGEGHKTTALLWKKLEEKARRLGDLEACEALGFSISSPMP